MLSIPGVVGELEYSEWLDLDYLRAHIFALEQVQGAESFSSSWQARTSSVSNQMSLRSSTRI